MNWRQFLRALSVATGVGYKRLPHVGDEELMAQERAATEAMRRAAVIARRTIRTELRRTEQALRR